MISVDSAGRRRAAPQGFRRRADPSRGYYRSAERYRRARRVDPGRMAATARVLIRDRRRHQPQRLTHTLLWVWLWL